MLMLVIGNDEVKQVYKPCTIVIGFVRYPLELIPTLPWLLEEAKVLILLIFCLSKHQRSQCISQCMRLQCFEDFSEGVSGWAHVQQLVITQHDPPSLCVAGGIQRNWENFVGFQVALECYQVTAAIMGVRDTRMKFWGQLHCTVSCPSNGILCTDTVANILW